MWVAMALAVGYTYEAEQFGQYLEMAHHVLKKTAEFSLDSLDYWHCQKDVRYMYMYRAIDLDLDLRTGTCS